MNNEPTVQGGPFDGAPQSVMDAASKAHCERCGVQIVAAPGMAGTLLFSIYLPAPGIRRRGFLCGPCGIDFKVFLSPSLADDAEFQAKLKVLRESL